MSEWMDVRMTPVNASKKPVAKKTPQDLSASIRRANVEYLSRLAKLNASKCNASKGEEVYKELIGWSDDMPDEEAKALLEKIHNLKDNDPKGFKEFLDLMENVGANSSKDCEGKDCDASKKEDDEDIDLMKDAEEWEAGGYKKPVTKSEKKELNGSEDAEQKEEAPAENNDSAYTADEVEQALNSDVDADPTVKLHLHVLQHGPDGPDSVDWDDPENEEFIGCIDEIAGSYGIQSSYTIDGDDITIELVGDDDVATTAAEDIQDQFNQSGFILMHDWGNKDWDDDEINPWGDDWEDRELTEDDEFADDDEDFQFDDELFEGIDFDAYDPHENN